MKNKALRESLKVVAAFAAAILLTTAIAIQIGAPIDPYRAEAKLEMIRDASSVDGRPASVEESDAALREAGFFPWNKSPDRRQSEDPTPPIPGSRQACRAAYPSAPWRSPSWAA